MGKSGSRAETHSSDRVLRPCLVERLVDWSTGPDTQRPPTTLLIYRHTGPSPLSGDVIPPDARSRVFVPPTPRLVVRRVPTTRDVLKTGAPRTVRTPVEV